MMVSTQHFVSIANFCLPQQGQEFIIINDDGFLFGFDKSQIPPVDRGEDIATFQQPWEASKGGMHVLLAMRFAISQRWKILSKLWLSRPNFLSE